MIDMKGREMDTKDKLNKLADMQSQLDAIRLHYQELRKGIIPQEFLDQLAEVDAEEKTTSEAAQNGIMELTEQIKADVISAGSTVKGDYLMAVWAKGRVSWDTKALDGVAAIYPEVAKLRKEGEPSVSIRKVG